jgi:hypothetical protein
MHTEQGIGNGQLSAEVASLPHNKIVDPENHGFVTPNQMTPILVPVTSTLKDYMVVRPHFEKLKCTMMDWAHVGINGNVMQAFRLPLYWLGYNLHLVAESPQQSEFMDSRTYWYITGPGLNQKLLLWVDVIIEGRGVLHFYPELQDALYSA